MSLALVVRSIYTSAHGCGWTLPESSELSFLIMETQVLSSGLDSAGISILSPLPEDSVTAVARRVLASTEAHHSMAERWIRVEPWNELLCRGEAIEEGQDKHQGENIGGDHTRENEELQARN